MEGRNETYVYDSSFLNGDREHSGRILQSLYEGVRGLGLIRDEEIEIPLYRLNFLNCLMEKRKLVIIPEVIKEANEHLRIVNKQIDFIKNQLSRKQHQKRGEDQLEKEQQKETLEKIEICVNEFYKLVRKYQINNSQINWEEVNQKHYDYFFQKATRRSKDISQESVEDKVRKGIRKPVNIGAELETDQKIIATSFTLAYSSPVIILTRDRGLERLTRRISLAIKEDPRSPHNPIYILNPDYEDIHSQGKQFFPWIHSQREKEMLISL